MKKFLVIVSVFFIAMLFLYKIDFIKVTRAGLIEVDDFEKSSLFEETKCMRKNAYKDDLLFFDGIAVTRNDIKYFFDSIFFEQLVSAW